MQSGVVNPGNNGLNNTGNRTLTGFLTSPLEFGFNNNNSAGVSGGTAAANQAAAAAVTTGLEFSVALADIGNPGIGDLIKIHAAYGNGDNNFHSNQILGRLAGRARATWAATAAAVSPVLSAASTSTTLPATSSLVFGSCRSRRRLFCSGWRGWWVWAA